MTNPTLERLDELCAAATLAQPVLRHTSGADRARLLNALADALDAAKSQLVAIAAEETHLAEARLVGEVARTSGQLRNFAADAAAGAFTDHRFVPALPDRQPLPRPQLDRAMIPIGPVAVFGSSNFPFAFSVLGGDTASALAAGCAVIVKAHSGHLKLSHAVADLAVHVVSRLGLPKGTFSLLGCDHATSDRLIQHPAIKAVGFTGSAGVGRKFMDLAAARPDPIPVFAEMGSLNPVVVLPGTDPGAFSAGLVGSVSLGVGQFCTKPGIVFGIESPEWRSVCEKVTDGLRKVEACPMLTDSIGSSYVAGFQAAVRQGLTPELIPSGPGAPGVLSIRARQVIANPHVLQEIFGPTTTLVSCESGTELLAALARLEGQLTGTVHGGTGESDLLLSVVEVLETKVGRLIFGGFPTGVEVCEGMQHGGPYPASSDARFTSVGNHAVTRWLRPISYQNAPEAIRQKFLPK